MYTYVQYLQTKINNSLLERLENFVSYMTEMLGMPTIIVGLHGKFKNAVSGKEQDIRNITPRCVLTWSGLKMDKQCLTAPNASTGIVSTDEHGNVKEHVLPYRRLPLQASFKLACVFGDVAEAIRMSEYLAILAMQVPVCKGDEHTKSTIILEDAFNVELQPDSNDVTLSGNVDLNMQILIPLETAKDATEYPLAGVGVLMPDGHWDETPYGEPILDEEGKPVLDEDGNPLYGDFIGDGWYRLHHNIKVHPHRIQDKCDCGKESMFVRPAGAEQKTSEAQQK